MRDSSERIDIKIFKEKILRELHDRIGENCKISLEEIIKNNGVIVEGITIEGDNSQIRPFFHLKDLYRKYCNGVSVDTIVDDIIRKPDCDVDVVQKIIESYRNFDYISKNVMFKLINYNKNSNCLKNVPHRKFLDLAIVYYCSFEGIQEANGNILVNESHMKSWGVDEEKLYCCAMKNTREKNRAVFADMKTMLMSMLKENCVPNLDEMPEFFEIQESQMEIYVLTNESNSFGAGAMLYDGLIRQYAYANDTDFYIIPSSVHEILLIPAEKKDYVDIRELTCIVKEVNDTNVLDEEVLSYNIYYYSRQDNTIVIA